MTRDDGTAWGEAEAREATLELQRALAARFKGRPLPPDLVITTRTEIEQREFTAYAKGWRDRGEHDERRRAETARARTGRPSSADATVLPFPQQNTPGPRQNTPGPRPGPHAGLSGPPAARPHPDDEPS
jgi:hypothetical protein